MTPALCSLVQLLARIAVEKYWAELLQEKQNNQNFADNCATTFADSSADPCANSEHGNSTTQGEKNDN